MAWLPHGMHTLTVRSPFYFRGFHNNSSSTIAVAFHGRNIWFTDVCHAISPSGSTILVEVDTKAL